MNLWSSVGGILEVELTSARTENALAAVNSAGITISHMEQVGDLTCRFAIASTDRRKLESLIKKRGETLRIKHREGIFWTVKALLTRPVLLGGCLVLLAAVFYLPSRILFVQVEGNHRIPTQRILTAAEECGIHFGASRREVRSEKVKNDLLDAVEQLQWAGVNTSGCVATVSVRERSEVETEQEDISFSNIIASRDGYILSGIVTQGTPLFQVGQTVQKGQILISGYTDCGLCIQVTRSEGEILAQTKRDLEAVTPAECIQHGPVTDVKRKYSMIFRKKRINLWKDSGISEGSCGRMYEEYYATLPGGFQLPIALCVEEYRYCAPLETQVPQIGAEEALRQFADSYVFRQMIAGKIWEKEETVSQEGGVYRFQGVYICTEMIGREQREQIGDTNGKDS